jgi:hypothetical protein
VATRLIHTAAFDIEAPYQVEFDRWYEAEHVPAMLERPGWRAARRYACLDGEPRDLVVYDLDEAALDGAERPSEAPFRTFPEDHRIRDYRACTMRRIAATAADPRDAPLINYVTVEIEPDHAAAFSRWYDEVHVPEITACPGWLGNERYEALDGDPLFLAMYGLSDAERPFASPEFGRAVGWDEHLDHIRGYHGFRIYRLTATFGD